MKLILDFGSNLGSLAIWNELKEISSDTNYIQIEIEIQALKRTKSTLYRCLKLEI